ncbi:MAG: GNAT family N-acetyltransferase, partial [Angustibacter sp.]
MLRDGLVVHLRPIRPTDAPAVARLHDGQSEESIYLRFFALLERLTPTELAWFTTVDHRDRVCLVATLGEDIVGIGRYDVTSPSAPRTADIAFNISDAHHGRGIGSVLLEHLTAAARERGVQRFTADTLPENDKMLSVFSEAGYSVQRFEDDGIVQVSFDVSPTEASDRVRQSREQRAEARSMRAVLRPGSIAVIGVLPDPDSPGQRVLRQLQAAGFTGSVTTVGPGQALPERFDLAIVVAPVAEVMDPARSLVPGCAAAGARALVVLSRGFAETGAEGGDLQYRLVRQARAHGMRVVGPNSLGLINTDPHVSLNATTMPDFPASGGLGLFCQSTAIGVAVLRAISRRRLGLSTFLSAGNRADVSGNDLMQYWLDDGDTQAVALYLESIGNPRKFTRVARRLARAKPVLVVKSGQSTFGVPPGHSVRESRLPPETFDEVLRQSGVIRCESLHQLFDVAQLAVHQPLPLGHHIAIVSNSHALGALAAGAAASWGLTVRHGPITVDANGSPADYQRALAAADRDPGVHSVVVGCVPPADRIDLGVAHCIARMAAASTKPWVVTFSGLHGITAELSAGASVVPAYPTPEEAVRALVLITRYASW